MRKRDKNIHKPKADFDAMYDIYMDESVNPFMLHGPMDKESFRGHSKLN
jgi:hypothetical protein